VVHLARKITPVLVVLPSESMSEEVGQNLNAFAKLLNFSGAIIPLGLAGLQTERFDRIVLNDKIRAVRALQTPSILVASVAALKETLCFLNESLFTLATGQALGRDTLVRLLFSQGYERVKYVEQPFEFAVRGGVVDFYGAGAMLPFRVEYLGDTIEEMRGFDPSTQRSGELLKQVEFYGVSFLESLKKDTPLQPEKDFWELFPKNRPVLFYDEQNFSESPSSFFNGAVLSEFASPHSGKTFLGGVHPSGVESLDFLQTSLGQNRMESLFRWMEKDGKKIPKRFLSCGTEGEEHRVRSLIAEYKVPRKTLQTFLSDLSTGFMLPRDKIVLLTDREIYSRYQTRYLGFQHSKSVLTRPVQFFEEGDLVVHYSYGIGIYRGATDMQIDEKMEEVMVIEYAEDAKLYVPRDQFFLLEKYVGTGATAPPLDHLSSTRWIKKRESSHQAIRDYAAKILKVEAARELQKGTPLRIDFPEVHDFEHSFPFQETPDQERAILDVKKDLADEKPMHRLILGDVGYGKTEVAARAAFIVAMGGKQVALMVPTTILAEQHTKTFRERMAEYPVRIEVLSRFTPHSKVREILSDLKRGTVDIVIGTHRLVQKDVAFRDLGLLIVDEEQRFGVAHKDYWIQKNPLVPILSLSATPIPRTLYLSLMGARNMSAIMTPPKERREVETQVIPEDFQVVKSAILLEIQRGGQIFFVHNRVQSIEKMRTMLLHLLPSVSIGIAHGQLPEGALKSVMEDFESRKIQVLLATNIIESGLDFPNANTLIVHQVELFGLADLYQLRGRIGRYNRKAYAYFLLTPGKPLNLVVKRRIRAIHEFAKPGGGYRVAMKDLEIRGAGNILGTVQSGHIATIGFDLYCKLLRDSIKSIRGESITPTYEVKIFLGKNGALPVAYMPDFQDRFFYTKRLASAESIQDIEEVAAELKDKFGRPWEEVLDLITVFKIKCLCRQRSIAQVELVRNGIVFYERNGVLKRFPSPPPRENIFSFVLKQLGCETNLFLDKR
jgi:transcription-repair coupling factor (superfamily II helicase)